MLCVSSWRDVFITNVLLHCCGPSPPLHFYSLETLYKVMPTLKESSVSIKKRWNDEWSSNPTISERQFNESSWELRRISCDWKCLPIYVYNGWLWSAGDRGTYSSSCPRFNTHKRFWEYFHMRTAKEWNSAPDTAFLDSCKLLIFKTRVTSNQACYIADNIMAFYQNSLWTFTRGVHTINWKKKRVFVW